MAAATLNSAWLALARLACALTLALSAACASNEPARDDGIERERVEIKGRVFHLELALDEPTRMKGLGGRTSIDEDGGMLFVFPDVRRLGFVMRDCPMPIDIAFLDGAGRVVAIHEMQPEAPRREHESDFDYETRLKRYDSRFPAQFAVEVRGGTLRALGLETGDLIRFDAQGLKRRTR